MVLSPPSPSQSSPPRRTTPAATGTAPSWSVATVDGARQALALVGLHGWDGEAGTELLRYARERVVLPVVRRSGLQGPAADQAEASGWEAAWDALRTLRPGIRSPWGVVTVAVRRAVAGEMLAATYVTGVRTAWSLRAARDTAGSPHGRVPAPLLLDETVLARTAKAPLTATAPLGLGPRLDAVADAMTGLGWSRQDVESVVDWMVHRLARPRRRGSGWRALASWSGLPPWQARRVLAVLEGEADRPGMVERVVRHGVVALAHPEARAAMLTTLGVRR